MCVSLFVRSWLTVTAAVDDGIDLSHEDALWYHGDLLRDEAKTLLLHHGGVDG